MATLNKVACEAMLEFDPHSCTDITGFGLSGHALGMAKGSKVRMRFRFRDIPIYAESLELIGQGVATSVTNSNLQVAQDYLTFSGPFSDDEKWLIVDPQTSGGLLISLPAAQAPKLVARLRERGNSIAAVIGEVVPADGRPGLEFLK
jgi:selenide,water dikinase